MGTGQSVVSKPWVDGAPADYLTHRMANGEDIYIHKTCIVDNTTIGRFTYIAERCVMGGPYPIGIGRFCSIAQDFYCWTKENHPTRYVSCYPLRSVLGLDIGYDESEGKPCGVTIGNDVWVGQGVKVLSGVTVGDGCVIGTRALVTRDCEPYGIYGGVPARLIRKRFSQAVIAELLELRWWLWPLDKIRCNSRFFGLDLERLNAPLSSYVVFP